ncbi:hypothetical protein RRF57_008805 [Xylaria bambusicola]|uniref:Peptidase C14 caspase domain-containing protein n=1 Tax=Xylaria bambusicola TaxID=326684 RepID=A0AAN7UUJ4_9PEZI
MSSPKHYAVLIGVDLYIRQPLHSCVRDVDLVEGYLKTLQQENRFNLLDITKLTASNPTSHEPGLQVPPENSETLATLQNIKDNLSRVASESTEGDHVYVHFSGHGTISRDGEPALVPYGCEDGGNGSLRDCLAGIDLVKLLNQAVLKGVKVLLALDCCFSGKMPRNRPPDAVRYIPFVSPSDTGSAKLQPHQAHHGVFPSNATFRGASARANWLMDPKGYTILTACGPTQITHGLKFVDGGLHGAFTYFLVRALQRLGSLNMSHMVLFQFICAMFRAMESPQIPQMKGRGDFTFFGTRHSPDDSFFPIFKLPSGKIVVQAGKIMGVHENDKLVLTPLSIFTFENWDRKYGLATAQNVGGVTAEVKVDDFDCAQIDRGGWIARLLKLCENVPTNSDPARGKLLSSQADDLGKQGQDLQEDVLFPPGYTGATAPFKATINEHGRFEIRDREERRVDFDALSLLPAHSPSIRAQVLSVLAYLTRYDDIVNMKASNESEILGNAVDIKLCREFGGPFPDTEVINVEDGEVLRLSIINNSERSFFVNIFCLNGEWEIINMLEAENTLLPPKKSTEDIEIEFMMLVPEPSILRGINSCEDIFKVFLTTRQVPLANLAAVKPQLRGSLAESEDDLPDPWIVRTLHIHTTKMSTPPP